MRLVILAAHTAEGEPQHRYLVGRLLEEFGEEVAAIIVATGKQRSVFERARRWLKRYSLPEIVSRIAARGYRKAAGVDQARHADFERVFFPDKSVDKMPGGDKIIRLPLHNSQECRELLRSLKPDIVAVYGTLIIGKKLIETVPRLINVHTGLSPDYRGSDTIFWPIHNEEPEKIGVTVHRLDTGIDSGAILARGRPEILPEDTEHTVFAKSVIVGTDLLCRAIRREYSGEAAPLDQTLANGREYRSVDRGLQAERKVEKLLQSGIFKRTDLKTWSEEF